MGILFLLPVVYLAIYVKRSKTFAHRWRQQRLAWYVERLDRGGSVKEPEPILQKPSVRLLNWTGKMGWRLGVRSDWNTEPKTWHWRCGALTNAGNDAGAWPWSWAYV